MSTVDYEVIIATTEIREAAEELKTRIGTLSNHTKILVAFTEGWVNGAVTLFIGPDGSKSGWPEDKEGDRLREWVIQQLESFTYEDGSSPFKWVEVRYGETGQTVLRGNCSSNEN